MHNLVQLLHPVEGELEQGGEVSQLLGDDVDPLLLVEKVCCYPRVQAHSPTENSTLEVEYSKAEEES